MSHPEFWRRRHSKGRLIAVSFMVGSTCFALGSFPPYFEHLDPRVVAVTFFVGSIFFTAAAFGQLTDAIVVRHAHRGARPRTWTVWRWDVEPLDFWAAGVQFVGTLFFNISTGFAIDAALDEHAIDRLVWRPDVYGSIAFLVASYLAEVAVTHRPWRWATSDRPGWIAKLNLLGSVAFGFSAIAAFSLPTTEEVLNIRIVNLGTLLGAVCFFAGAALLLPEVGRPTANPEKC
jgi:hypothetical protein